MFFRKGSAKKNPKSYMGGRGLLPGVFLNKRFVPGQRPNVGITN
jgi:hypothetical protein